MSAVLVRAEERKKHVCTCVVNGAEIQFIVLLRRPGGPENPTLDPPVLPGYIAGKLLPGSAASVDPTGDVGTLFVQPFLEYNSFKTDSAPLEVPLAQFKVLPQDPRRVNQVYCGTLTHIQVDEALLAQYAAHTHYFIHHNYFWPWVVYTTATTVHVYQIPNDVYQLNADCDLKNEDRRGFYQSLVVAFEQVRHVWKGCIASSLLSAQTSYTATNGLLGNTLVVDLADNAIEHKMVQYRYIGIHSVVTAFNTLDQDPILRYYSLVQEHNGIAWPVVLTQNHVYLIGEGKCIDRTDFLFHADATEDDIRWQNSWQYYYRHAPDGDLLAANATIRSFPEVTLYQPQDRKSVV